MVYHGKHFFIGLTGEEFFVGWFPSWHSSFRWKSAEDGRTWIRPTFWVGGYK